MATDKRWMGEVPETCDVCDVQLSKFTWWVDGRTVHGPWANMCPDCFEELGTGLGIGYGQKYDTGTLKKLEG